MAISSCTCMLIAVLAALGQAAQLSHAGGNFLARHDATGAEPAEGPRQLNFHIFGLYNTGTNLLQTVLHTAFPDASVCPDTRVHFKATGKHTCLSAHMSKHAHPAFVRDWLKSRPDTFAAIMIRDPLSNLLSSHRRSSAYGLAECSVGKDWLWQKCKCEVDMREPDPLCRPNQTEYSSLAQVWNDYAEGQLALATSPDLMHRVQLIRYEDLVANASATVAAIAKMVAVAPRSLGDCMAESSSNGARGHGQEVALEQIRKQSCVKKYSAKELSKVCSDLDGQLLSRLAYDKSCH
eukprot:TRINITY_DN9215_c0_g1_i1.p1 TRINITY_DN9215_c0_g1~~TRINITY_DN9215_c0_g1_i1.p1  ORF type:complete len:293 (+),score=44.49 TRINITY_DN9215_c0_g1_i1:111-989(+)